MARISIPLVFVAVGVVLGGVAGWTYDDRRNFAERAEQVPGTVVSVRSSTDSEGDTTYAPVYAYQHGGAPREYSPDGMSSSQPTVGEQVTLFVDPTGDRVMADTFMDRWFLPVLLGGIGMALLVVGVAAAVTGGGRGLARSAAAREQRRVARGETLDGEATSSASHEGRDGPFVSGRQRDSKGPFL